LYSVSGIGNPLHNRHCYYCCCRYSWIERVLFM